MKLPAARRNDAVMAAVMLAVIVADQLTKRWIVAYFRGPFLRPPIPLLGPYLELQYVQNTGVAFSLLAGQSVLFLFITVAVVVIGTLYWRMRETGPLLLKLTFGLILGGALGNLLDRARHTYVVDFVHFQIPGRFDFAVFNVADSAITVGVLTLAVLLWRGVPTAAPTTDTPPAGDAPAVPDADASPRRAPPDRLAARRAGAVPLPSARPSTVPRVRNPNPRVR